MKMHAKHRNGPGDGYRGNAVGVSSIGGSSRSSYEGPIRGHRMYNPEYRNYNRGGYARGGHSKHFQHQIRPTRETDILIEAGRLAAEYLASKELLSPAALYGKYSDASLDKQFGNVEIGSLKTEISDGRVSVHSRLGNSLPSFGQGRRRYPDEYISVGTRSSMKGRKRSESLKINGAEVNRDFKRTGSLNSNYRTSSYTEGGGDAFDGHDDEQTVVEDVNSDVQNSSLVETSREADNDGHFNPGFVKGNKSDYADAKDSSLSNEVSKPFDVEGRPTKEFLDVDKTNDNKRAIEGLDDHDVHQKRDENEVKAFSGETSAASSDHVDLLKHCKFVNLPKRPRSSLTIKGPRSSRNSTNDDKSISRKELLEGSSSHVMENNVTDSPSVENNVSLHPTTIHGECSRSGSKEPEIDDSLSSFGTSNSVLMESGKKRSIDCDVDDMENIKKSGQWVLPFYDESCLDISLSPKIDGGIQVMEEKDLFPASFKLCDLNLSGSHEADSMRVYPSTKQVGEVSVDIDLSISNTCNLSTTNGKNGVSENSLEIIDLEKGPAMEVQTFGNPDRRKDALFTGLDGFPSNSNVISDVHDGFGLMISDYLGNQSPSCSSVPTDLTSLHNQMVLPNHEGILADDDSIYMSLGEIPISFWGLGNNQIRTMGNHFELPKQALSVVQSNRLQV